MKVTDIIRRAGRSLKSAKMRTLLTATAIAIAASANVMLLLLLPLPAILLLLELILLYPLCFARNISAFVNRSEIPKG